MGRRDYRLTRLRPEEAGVPVIDLTKAHASWVEPKHHARIHGRDYRWIDFDSFEMSNAPAYLAMMKGEVPIIPAVDVRGICPRFLEELRLILVVIRPKRSITPAQGAVAVEDP